MGERFAGGTVTVLFTDVEGSTDLRDQRGDDAAQEILRAHDVVTRQCVQAHQGREVKALGDGFMVAFTSARKAVACAIAIQQAMEEQNWTAPGREVRVRVGVNTGEVIEEDQDLFGAAVNAAARIAARARGGEILVSEVVKQLVGGSKDFLFRDRGRCRLKGFADRWHLYSVVWTAPDRARPVVPVANRTTLVAREAELAELRGHLDQAIRGAGVLVMVGGEPGVGKTRLAEELAAEASSRDIQVFLGHCYEMEGSQPFIAFVEILEQALARASSPQAFAQALGDEAPQIARLLPRLRQLCPAIPPPVELPPEQERRYLFNSIREALARGARARPMLLVLDDIQWADEPTMMLLRHIAEGLPETPIMMLATHRDTETDLGEPFRLGLEDMVRRRLIRRMTLRRLSEEGAAKMLSALSGQRPPPDLVRVVYAETEGNPFFTEEVFRHLVEEGRLFDANGQFRSDLSTDDLDVPEGVRLVIGRRLRRLGDDGRKVLGGAAVLGRAFTFEVLQMLEETDEDSLLDLVEDAERAGLILSTSHRADDDHFIFAHELIRQTLLTDLSPPRRRRLHARAAEALERAHAASLTEHAAAIAHHLLEAGAAADPKRTFHYLAMAGESAMAAAAYEDALRHFENASPTKHLAGPREAADCLYGLGRAQRSLGRWDEAMDSFREALDAYAALGDTDREGQLCWQLAWQLNYQARWGEAIEIAQRGLASLGDVESPARAALLGLVGFVLGFTGQYEAGRETIDAALAVAEKVGDRLALGQALYAADIFNWGYARFNEAVDTGSRAAALLKESAALWDYAHAALFVQLSLHTLGRWDEAADLHEEVDPLADRIAHHFVVLVSRRERGARERQRTTDLARYEEFARGDLELNRTTGMGWIGQSYIFLALFDFWQGRWTQALTNIREGTRLESTGGISLWAPSLQLLITAYAGDPKETADLFRKLSAQLPQPGQEASIGSWQLACSAVEALAVIGEREQAASLYPLMAAAIESGLVVDGYIHGRPMHMLAGIAAGADRRWADAEGHYRAALEVAGRLGQRMERPDILRFYASMLLERGAPEDQQQARQLLEEALETYREMSMPRHVAMAEALLRNSEVGRDD